MEGAEAEWADLPPELLTMISGCHQNPIEMVRFRSVCRSWRSSTPPPPNILSPFFPLRLPFDNSYLLRPDSDIAITANAVYLLRLHSDRSKAWMVSAQESVAGNLVLRHPLSYEKIKSGNHLLDPDSFEIQTIARSYSHNGGYCSLCHRFAEIGKAAFIYEPNSSKSHSIGLCSYRGFTLWFRIDLNRGKATTASQLVSHHYGLRDFVSFNGRIFALDAIGVIYLFDHTNLRLTPIRSVMDRFCYFNFVVSDGELYLVSRCYFDDPPSCQIYRLVVETSARNHFRGIRMEKAEGLGDRVFVIGMDCAFSISTKNLPRLCKGKGNCVVFGKVRSSMCGCDRDPEYKGDEVFQLVGGQNLKLRRISSLQGYSDLFSPPASIPSSKRRKLKA